MSEEQTPQVAVQTPTIVSEEPKAEVKVDPTAIEPVANNGPAPTTSSWIDELNKADAKMLRSIPKIAGIIGSESHRAIEEAKKSYTQNQDKARHEELDKAFTDFVEGNTDYLKANHPKVYERYQLMQTERAKRDLEGVHSKAREEFAQKVGAAWAEEFQSLTDEERNSVFQEVAGKPDDESIATFNKAMMNVMLKRDRDSYKAQVDKDFETRVAAILKKERETIRQEESARLLAKTPAPEPKNGAVLGKAKLDVKGMSDEEFTKWYEGRFNQ